MNRIAAVSMVKNEGDVIESFVRHTLQFADELLVVDHDSSDGTYAILSKLQQEGLALTVRQLRQAAQVQSEVLTELMQEAFREHGADVVVPLDADEFLVADAAGTDCRTVLQQLDSRRVYGLRWVRYVLDEPERDAGMFLLARPAHRERQASSLEKVIIGRLANEKCAVTIAQGSHLALLQREEETLVLQTERAAGLHIAHFPWRSQEQAAAKAANGWIANAAKYSLYTSQANHWQQDFAKLKRQEPLLPEPLADGGEAAELRAGSMELRYGGQQGISAFASLLHTSEILAQAYAEECVLRRQIPVTILLPVLGDLEGMRRSLASALAQDYPYREIVLCHAAEAELPALKELMDSLGAPDELRVLAPDAELAAVDLKGRYVQWIFPGDVLRPEKIRQMVVTLEHQPELTFVMSNAAEWHQPAALAIFEDLPVSGTGLMRTEGRELWQYMLEKGCLFSGGISAALFRRTAMEACGWLEGGFADNQVLTMSMWGSVLEKALVGIYGEPGLQRPNYELCPAELCWHELEWFYLLEEYAGQPEGMTDAAYRQARRRFCEHGQQLAAVQASIGPKLYEQYGALLAQAAGAGAK